MFNIGPMELIVILLVALVIVGPKRLPEVGRSIGKSLRELRRATDDVRYSFEASLDDDERRADGDVAPHATEEPSGNGVEGRSRRSSAAPDQD
jgi:sec-independent protein translocase protein TatA